MRISQFSISRSQLRSSLFSLTLEIKHMSPENQIVRELPSGESSRKHLRFSLQAVYSQMSLRQKISIPFIVVFLAIWFLGTGTLGYYFSRKLELEQLQETEALAKLILREFEQASSHLRVDARLLSEHPTIVQAVGQDDKTTLLQKLLPLGSTLSVDLIKIVNQKGHELLEWRSPVIHKANLFDNIAISQAIHSVNLSSIIATNSPMPYVLVGTAPIKSPEGVLGGIIIGNAISNELLQQMTQGIDKYIVAFNNKQTIAATLENAKQIEWKNLLLENSSDRPNIQEIYIEREGYITTTLLLSGLANTELQLLLLSPLERLHRSQKQLWIAVGIFSFLGVAIASTVGYWIAGAIAQPIKKITDATGKLAHGDLNARVPVESREELSQLAIGFNLMAEQIQERDRELHLKMQELEETLEQLAATQTQLIQHEKMAGLGQMVAGLAHELNNPVSFIYGNVEYALDYMQELLNLIEVYQEEYPNPTEAVEEKIEEIELECLVEDLQKLLKSMKSGAERIKAIILDLRNFSRLDESDLKFVDLMEGLDNTLKILQHRFEAQGNRPEIEVIKNSVKLPQVECYAAKLNQVFMNLLNNAIDAVEMVAQPIIRINTELSDDLNEVKLEICDNGCGISDDIHKKIFNPFFTTKPVGKGTGMGLAVSYQIIVEQHDGNLQCFSKPNEGSVFLITLPIRHAKGIDGDTSDEG